MTYFCNIWNIQVINHKTHSNHPLHRYNVNLFKQGWYEVVNGVHRSQILKDCEKKEQSEKESNVSDYTNNYPKLYSTTDPDPNMLHISIDDAQNDKPRHWYPSAYSYQSFNSRSIGATNNMDEIIAKMSKLSI